MYPVKIVLILLWIYLNKIFPEIRFHYMPNIVNFIMLGSGYFCIPINILEFCSGTQLNCLEII